MKDTGLIDIWRDMHPNVRQYMHYSPPHLIYSRIDYFIIFNKDRSRIKESVIGTIDLSDHAPVYPTVDLGNYQRNSTWRFNSSLFNDPLFKKQMSNDIQMYIIENDNGEISPPILWDAAKAVLRGKLIAIAFVKKKKKQRQRKLFKLQNQLKSLEISHA